MLDREIKQLEGWDFVRVRVRSVLVWDTWHLNIDMILLSLPRHPHIHSQIIGLVQYGVHPEEGN